MVFTLSKQLAALFLFAALLSPLTPFAKTLPPETLVAQLGEQQLLLADVDAMAQQLPDQVRPGVFNNPTTIGNTLQTMLVRRAVVAPILQTRPAWLDYAAIQDQARRRVLAALALENMLRAQPEPAFEQMASAYYDANEAEYTTPASVSVRHILISTEDRDVATAFQQANKLRAQLLNGDLTMDEAVQAYSDDPGKVNNQGYYRRVVPGQMQPEFEAAAFALTQPGELSPPTKTRFGYHVIEFQQSHAPEVTPKESAVRVKAIQLRQDHIRNARKNYVKSLGPDPDKILLEHARSTDLANSPEFVNRLTLAIEEAVLRSYKKHYLATQVPRDLTPLAREYFLTRRKEFTTPRWARVLKISMDAKQDEVATYLDFSTLHELAQKPMGMAVLLALEFPEIRVEQVEFFEEDSGIGPAGGFAFGSKERRIGDIQDEGSQYYFYYLDQRREGRQKLFGEVRRLISRRLRNKQETLAWDSHVATFHQLPFTANREAVASLRTRYIVPSP